MTDRERIRDALDDLAKALDDPDTTYTEAEMNDIIALRERLEARLASEEEPQ